MVYVTLIQPSGANGRRKFANRREGDQILRWFELHAALVSARSASVTALFSLSPEKI
jgi:hypothetical protein